MCFKSTPRTRDGIEVGNKKSLDLTLLGEYLPAEQGKVAEGSPLNHSVRPVKDESGAPVLTETAQLTRMGGSGRD